jgi:hypothetical protein
MAKKFTCDICGQEFMEDRASVLVEKVRAHAQDEHGEEMEGDEIRAEMEDT